MIIYSIRNGHQAEKCQLPVHAKGIKKRTKLLKHKEKQQQILENK